MNFYLCENFNILFMIVLLHEKRFEKQQFSGLKIIFTLKVRRDRLRTLRLSGDKSQSDLLEFQMSTLASLFDSLSFFFLLFAIFHVLFFNNAKSSL